MTNVRAYNSPLRAEKARETREAILTALFELIDSAGAADEVSTEAIAQKAGVQRRTIFRHFATKDEMLAAFWPWLNARIGTSATPSTVKEVVDGPRRAFPRFDLHEPAIRASLHSKAGREMRIGTVAARRVHFARSLAPAIASLPASEAWKVEALAHLLFSASAWEVLKDYGGLTGAQAGEVASWALEVILSAVTSGDASADVASQPKETSDEV
ncbi:MULTISPECIES: helix-turn-helix domain-containing protein [unclassified Sinorhizobium]|uniref:TetR/AcrR family transcriptional regulator n=1 Tax=unclassified Sinorhizobium TaxID=2613772 RepID=UPI0024C2AED4|nr:MULTISPECIES: helix-turn-helix domain-containing protein [unclassified Sinorhizobium]MDK1378678.1 helix-turn-helix domain-containing protein [Sinorhizobium sp. 6-70]MDK1480746.1 helix-turn-helix domain-containing protein [Sinorhizobium sp. 6-117]